MFADRYFAKAGAAIAIKNLFIIVAAQSYVDGAVTGDSYLDGAMRGQSYVDGAVESQSEPGQ